MSLSRPEVDQSTFHCVLRALKVARCTAVVVGLMVLPAKVMAQAPPQPPQNARPQAAAQGPATPDPYKVNMLIRTTLIALSQANLTGNYSVLRDLGSPDFQAANSAARLSEVFADLRRRRLDFSPVVFFDPKLVRQPAFDQAGRLRLTGFIETRPEQINFDMLFENIGGGWRVFGLGVEMQRIAGATAASQPQEPSPKGSGSPPAKSKTSGTPPDKNQRPAEKSAPPKTN